MENQSISNQTTRSRLLEAVAEKHRRVLDSLKVQPSSRWLQHYLGGAGHPEWKRRWLQNVDPDTNKELKKKQEVENINDPDSSVSLLSSLQESRKQIERFLLCLSYTSPDNADLTRNLHELTDDLYHLLLEAKVLLLVDMTRHGNAFSVSSENLQTVSSNINKKE